LKEAFLIDVAIRYDIKGNNKYYIQSAFSLLDEEKRKQEERPLLNIGDSF